MKLTGAVVVAGDTQVQGVAAVDSKLKAVVADDFADVIDKLVLAFDFVQRAVALVDAQRIAELLAAAYGVVDLEGGQSRCVSRVEYSDPEFRPRSAGAFRTR